MGIFDKLKGAIGNKINDKKNDLEDRIVGKIIPGSTPTYPSSSSQSSGSAYVPPQDAAYEAKMEEMRKQKEMRSMELEMQMQERMMKEGGLLDKVMGAQAGIMNAATEALEEQNKNKK